MGASDDIADDLQCAGDEFQDMAGLIATYDSQAKQLVGTTLGQVNEATRRAQGWLELAGGHVARTYHPELLRLGTKAVELTQLFDKMSALTVEMTNLAINTSERMYEDADRYRAGGQ